MRKYLPVMLSIALAAPIFACGTPEEQQGENKQPTNTDGKRPGSDTDTHGTDQDTSNSKIARINQRLIAKDTAVTIEEAIITGIPTSYDKSSSSYKVKGVYVSDVIDQAKPYTGIYVYLQQMAEKGDFAIGDIVKITGTVDEYIPKGGKIGNRQIAKATLSKTGTGKVPAPAVVEASAVGTKFEYNEAGGYWAPGTHAADSDKYNGVYVKINGTAEGTNVIKSLKSNCEDKDATPVADDCLAFTGVELNNNIVLAKNGGMYTVNESLLVKGIKFTTAAGILSISYDAYILNPTAGADIQKEGGSGSHEGDDDDGKSDREYTEAKIDEIQNGDNYKKDDYVKVSGTVISHTGAPFENSYSFYIADDNANAIMIYSASYDEGTVLNIGSKVTVTGKVTDMTNTDGDKYTQREITGAGKPAIKVISQSGNEPDAAVVTLPVTESSRGKLAKIENLKVKEKANGYCYNSSNNEGNQYCTPVLVDEAGNEIKVSYLSLKGKGSDTHYGDLKKLIGDNFSTEGAEFASVTGILDVNYGVIKLYPRTQDDIVEAVVE